MNTWQGRLERELNQAVDRLIDGRAPRRNVFGRPLMLTVAAALVALALLVAFAGFRGSEPERPAGKARVPSSMADRMAARSVTCMDGNSGTQLKRDERPPAQACAAQPGASPGRWIACAERDGANITVQPSRKSCADLGLKPLPADFTEGQRRVLKLQSDIRAIEAEHECIAPGDLAQRVQALLDVTGWADWNAVERNDLSQGPCGHALWRGGDGSRTLSGSLIPAKRQILIAGEPPS
jgi:hypothetical protein